VLELTGARIDDPSLSLAESSRSYISQEKLENIHLLFYLSTFRKKKEKEVFFVFHSS